MTREFEGAAPTDTAKAESEPALSDIIARLEQAAEGSDLLDHAIIAALGMSADYDADGMFGGYLILPRHQRFTRSIDAALTLVPPGHCWILEVDPEWEAKINPRSAVFEIGANPSFAYANTAPLALALAALRARLRR